QKPVIVRDAHRAGTFVKTATVVAQPVWRREPDEPSAPYFFSYPNLDLKCRKSGYDIATGFGFDLRQCGLCWICARSKRKRCNDTSRRCVMAENVTKLPVKRETMQPSFTREWHPFESLHQEIDRLFHDFGMGFQWPFGRSLFAAEPLFRREVTWPRMPA